MNRFIALIFLLSSSIGIYAQSYGNSLAYVFDNLEVNRVPTGYLLDAAIELADLHKYNGVLSSDNYSDAASFRNVLATINSSKINAIGVSLDADSMTNALADSGVVNLGVAVYKYNYIVSNAITDNLLSYQGGKVYDVYSSGVWQNPYAEGYAFLFTPSIPGHTGTIVHYTFSSSHLYGNVNPCQILFDADDGMGYRTIGSSFDLTVSYSTTGAKELKMKVILNDNAILESHSHFWVYDLPAAPSSISTQPTGSRFFFLQSNPLVSANVSYKSSHSGGAVMRPFIFVEGFDTGLPGLVDVFKADSFCDWFKDGRYVDLWKRATLQAKGQFDFSWLYDKKLNNTIKDNYDVFYVDWMSPYADIRDNAALLVQIIDWVNGLKQSTAERNIVIGHSMGGLIARYALREMELNVNCNPHQTDYYVSLDSPHLGVNVPVGLQYAIIDLYSILYGQYTLSGLLSYHLFDPLLSYLMFVYSCPAAKQMMYYYCNAPSGTSLDSYHNSWVQELDLKGFPKGDIGHPIENLAIVNGGRSSYLPPTLLNASITINNTDMPSFTWLQMMLMLVCKTDNLRMSFTVKRDYGNCDEVCVSYGSFRKNWPWKPGGVSVSLFAPDSILRHNAPIGSPGLDTVKSSYLSFKDTIVCQNTSLDTIEVMHHGPELFVPVASALATPSYTKNFYSNPPTPKYETPFDVYYLNQSSSHHSKFEDSYCNWIHYQANSTMTGPTDFALSGDVFSVLDISGYTHPSWSVSDSLVATISNGVLSVGPNKSGIITVEYSNNNGNGAYIKKNRVLLAGFPSMTLSDNKAGTDLYEITASETTGDQRITAMLDTLVSHGKLRYIWGTKNGDNTTTWTDTTSVRSFTCTAPNGVNTTVCMKIREMSTGRESAENLVVIVRYNADPYFTDPSEVLVNQFGTPFMHYNYVSGLNFLQYFAVWVNSYYNGTVPVPDNVLVGSEQVSLATSFQQTIDDELTTVYCFDILGTTTMQNGISDFAANGSGGLNAFGVSIRIRSGTTDIMYLVLPFASFYLPDFPRPL